MVPSDGADAPETGYSVAGILQRYLPDFQRTDALTLHRARILSKLITCRTPNAGSHAWQCADCGHYCANYNSCGNRHCLTCTGWSRMEWLGQMESWTLPCHYWHIVFTLPHEFNALAAANPKQLYGALFFAGTNALMRYLRKAFGVVPCIASMLHTWGQAMKAHIHSHNVVSCGGLSTDGKRWIDIDPHDARLQGEGLPAWYRKLFLKRLRKLFAQGELVLPASMAEVETSEDFDDWLAPLANVPWMVKVQPPPTGCDGPSTVLGYISRYMSGTCIADRRILEDDGERVTIAIKNYRMGGGQDKVTMTGVQFVRRFVQHILPVRFRRLRYAGLWGPRKREERLKHCRRLLGDRVRRVEEPETPSADEAHEEEAPEEIEDAVKACPRCRSRDLIFIERYQPGMRSQEVAPNKSSPHPREAVPP